jgi:hypothetical protein
MKALLESLDDEKAFVQQENKNGRFGQIRAERYAGSC